jgi:hypothetical protein
MDEQEPIRIVIPVEEEEPLKPEQDSVSVSGTAVDAGRKVAGVTVGLAQKAANSEAGRAATRKMHELGDRGVRYVGTRMADTAEQQARETVDAVQQRLKEADWEKEARSGVAGGLSWLSGRLNELAQRFDKPGQEKGPANQDQPDQ